MEPRRTSEVANHPADADEPRASTDDLPIPGSEASSRTSLQLVHTPKKQLREYLRIMDEEMAREIRQLARDLQGVRLMQLNSTANGGGVAELLYSLVPLEVECGLQAEWCLLSAEPEFFGVTKGFHNAMQGQRVEQSDAGLALYLEENERSAKMLAADEYDVIIVHDPQPVAVRHFAQSSRAHWIWRCHIDSSAPDPGVWTFLQPFVEEYDVTVFTKAEFAPWDLAGPARRVITPAIDPFSAKNRGLPRFLCRDEISAFGIDLGRPLVLQVSRFDPWKDPIGVIEAYRIVKRELPEVQLALVGAMAEDDPQGWEVYNIIQDASQGDSDIHLLTNLAGVGAHEVNAFQRVADVVIQKSIREGFGLAVSEAVWKGTPVVGGNTGGIPLQIQDGMGGFLVNSVEQCAERTLFLLTHPDEAELIARRGWQHVHDNFLVPRLLRDELRLIRSLVHRDSNKGA